MLTLPKPHASAPILYGERLSARELLPWSWAEDRLTDARTYWVATVHPSTRPHTRPVWGVWLETGFWFATGGLTRHNLSANDQISVHLEDGMQVVIVEGTAVQVVEPETLARVCEAYSSKYDYPIQVTTEDAAGTGIADDEGNRGPMYRVVPQAVFAWDDEMSSPTRWTFPA